MRDVVTGEPSGYSLGPWTLAGPAALGLVAATVAVVAPLAGLAAAGLLAAAVVLAGLPVRSIVPAMVFLAPMRVFVEMPVLNAELSEAGLLGLTLATGLCLRRLLRGGVVLTRWEWTIALWWCWLLLTCIWAEDRRAGLHGAYQWTLLFASIFLTVECFGAGVPPDRAARRLITAVLALAAVWSAIGFLQMAIGPGGIMSFLESPAAALFYPTHLLQYKLVALDFNWLSGGGVRPFGPFINATEFGAFTAVGFGIAVAVVVSRSRIAPRWLALLAAGLTLSANVAALKATGWVAATTALITVFVALGGSIRRVVFSGVLTLGAAVLLVTAFRQPLTDRLQDLVAREGVPLGAVGAVARLSTWSHYSRVALERPVIGSGLFTANAKGPLRWTMLGNSGTIVANRLPTENGYLTVLIETGLVGLGALGAVIGGAVIIGLRLARRVPGDVLAQAAGVAAVGIVALLVGSLVNDGFAEETNQFLMGVLIGIIVVARRLVGQTGRILA